MNGTDKTAPERIWCAPKDEYATELCCMIAFSKPSDGYNIEYVNADKVRELEAEVAEAAKIKAALRAARVELNPVADGGGAWHYEARLASEGVAVAYARVRDKNNPHYEDVVAPNSQEAEMWAYDLIPLYAHPASDTALRAALKPFALIAEYDISESDADDDTYRPMEGRLAVAKPICIGDLRRALAALNTTEKNNG